MKSLPAPDPTRPVHQVEAMARRTEQLLEAHVPLTLLLDLGGPEEPESVSLYEVEGGDADWAQR